MVTDWWARADRPWEGPQEEEVSIFAVTMDMPAGAVAAAAAAGQAELPGRTGSVALIVVAGERSSSGRWDCAGTSRLRCWRRY